VFVSPLARGAHEGWTGATTCRRAPLLVAVHLVSADDPYGPCHVRVHAKGAVLSDFEPSLPALLYLTVANLEEAQRVGMQLRQIMLRLIAYDATHPAKRSA
jgi:hypothetical protein